MCGITMEENYSTVWTVEITGFTIIPQLLQSVEHIDFFQCLLKRSSHYRNNLLNSLFVYRPFFGDQKIFTRGNFNIWLVKFGATQKIIKQGEGLGI